MAGIWFLKLLLNLSASNSGCSGKGQDAGKAPPQRRAGRQSCGLHSAAGGGVRARCPDPTVGIGAEGKEKHPAGQ